MRPTEYPLHSIRDVTGKCIVHYGAGGMATDCTMKITDCCISAYQVSAHFGKKVFLDGLSSAKYNGKSGVLVGFDSDTGRCIICLDDSDEPLKKIKACNILNATKEMDIIDTSRKLIDAQDRGGTTCLHEVAMSTRDDVVKFLLVKHDASMDVKDLMGTCTRSMAFSTHGGFMHNTNEVLKKHAIKKEIKKKKAESLNCAYCDKPETKDNSMLVCSQCKCTFYCSRKCQKMHWKVHKPFCASTCAGIKLDVPPPLPASATFTSVTSGKCMGVDGGYNPPKGLYQRV